MYNKAIPNKAEHLGLGRTHRSSKMENFTLNIETVNAAFDNGSTEEIARILRQLAQRLENEGMEAGQEFVLRDANGNKVGSAKAD